MGESALALLNAYQIPVADWSIAKSAESAAQRAKEMGYPVVLKIVSPQWLHKSDWGGVRLNVKNDMELKAAYGELLGQFQQRTPDGLLTGILVQKQMQGVELLMGIKRDPQFGPVLVVGMGGIYTEIFKDLARGLAPLSRADAEAMLQSLRIYPILTGASRSTAGTPSRSDRNAHGPFPPGPGLSGNQRTRSQPGHGHGRWVLVRGLPGGHVVTS